MDPLASVAAAVASRRAIAALVPAALVLLAAVAWPRSFCAAACPFGALIDVTDFVLWPVRRLVRERRPRALRAARYLLLAFVLAAAVLGANAAGLFAAIPVLTRGLAFTAHPLEAALRRGRELVPAAGGAVIVSAAVFAAVLALGAVKRRFWCSYLCPTGAALSLLAPLRLRERRVDSSCVKCGKCRAACPFDAVRNDFSTFHADCALCGACAAACPVNAIHFPPRGARPEAEESARPAGAASWPPASRRAFLASGAAALAAGAAFGGASRLLGGSARFVRPPGALPEGEFLARCLRCGGCYRSCPGQVLQPVSFSEGGLAAFWTPHAVGSFAGCESECANCGAACPTGAIARLPLDEKRCAKMGTARVDGETCISCGSCVEACRAAGYRAAAFEPGAEGAAPPVVDAALCVGCGSCECACRRVNVDAGILRRPAIAVSPEGEARLLPPARHSEARLRRLAGR